MDPSSLALTVSPRFRPLVIHDVPEAPLISSAIHPHTHTHTMAPIKVGIVGYGLSAKCFHLPYILPNADLAVHAFLQRAPAPGPSDLLPTWGHCTFDFPAAKHYRTADEFFADAEIELVVVCTSAHEEFVEGAIRAGKHGMNACAGGRAGIAGLIGTQWSSRSPL